jgi:hypothetical protein
MFASRRRHERIAAGGTATVYQGSNRLELPILDVSLGGIRLQTSDSTRLDVGGVCFIALPEHGKHDAQVVAVRSQSFAFQFLIFEPEGVRSFVDAQKTDAESRSRAQRAIMR